MCVVCECVWDCFVPVGGLGDKLGDLAGLLDPAQLQEARVVLHGLVDLTRGLGLTLAS